MPRIQPEQRHPVTESFKNPIIHNELTPRGELRAIQVQPTNRPSAQLCQTLTDLESHTNHLHEEPSTCSIDHTNCHKITGMFTGVAGAAALSYGSLGILNSYGLITSSSIAQGVLGEPACSSVFLPAGGACLATSVAHQYQGCQNNLKHQVGKLAALEQLKETAIKQTQALPEEDQSALHESLELLNHSVRSYKYHDNQYHHAISCAMIYTSCMGSVAHVSLPLAATYANFLTPLPAFAAGGLCIGASLSLGAAFYHTYREKQEKNSILRSLDDMHIILSQPKRGAHD